MAYAQLAETANIIIEKSGNVIYSGKLVFHPLPSDVASYVISRAYGDVNTGYRGDDYDRVTAGATGTIYHTFLWDNLTAAGQYIDIYNADFGKNIKLRYYAVSRGTYLQVNVYLIVFGYQLTLESNHLVAGRDQSNRLRYYLLNGYIDSDNGYGMLSCELALPESSYVNLLGSWSGGTSELNMIKQSLYTLFTSGGGGGGGSEPYVDGGTSTSGGGENATFDLTSDDIDIPTLPSISASGAGLLTLYQVSLQNMHDFASYLWSPLFDVDTLKKLFNDPMDAIISLGMLPFTPTGGTVSNIFIGESDSGVSASRLGSQYYELDMGSLTLDTFYDSALDLNPYTKVDLYLPYCGTVSINPDEFDGKSIHVVYHVDILTGACVVFVEDGSRVLVQSQGNILTAIPFTSKDFKSIFGAVLGDAAAAGAALFALPTGGISAAAAVGIVGGAAMNSVNSKLNMPHGGQCASTAGFLSVQKPYLIITRPAQCLPEDNAAYQGYPAYITATVGDLTGFIKISEAHFDGFTCTDGELKEIDRLLKEGVYVHESSNLR